MMRRKRGGLKGTRKMAKKTAPAALQAEISNDEEWAKLLQKPGLIVVDVYTEWSGPCTGMVSVLKKMKMEVGGDALSYATAKCDYIADLERFQGRSEPVWMFIHEGQMVNLMFGARCPQLLGMIARELERIQNGEEHEFSMEVSKKSPEEEIRLKAAEEARIAKEAAKKARKAAEAKARYEAEMLHFTTSLRSETCLLLYPWVFKDEEGHRRDKRTSPPYVELVDEIFPSNFNVEQELRKRLDEEILKKILHESDYTFSEREKQLLFDGKCMFMRLKLLENVESEPDVEQRLKNLLFGAPELSAADQEPVECFANRHRPAFVANEENKEELHPLVWVPANNRNKAAVFKTIFPSYTNTNFPYEDKSAKAPIVLFKYDYTRKNDLRLVLEEFGDELVDFGVFESDKLSETKLIARSLDEFEEGIKEKTGYEIMVCVVKKTGCEAFLGFAGIGPYYVSESPEKAIEEAKLYFPEETVVEETQSDDEEKVEEVNNEEANESK